LGLEEGATVLDIATGKGETLCRVAARYGARCTGVERSPYFCDEAQAKASERGLAERVTIVQQDGADFTAPDASYDAAMCMGAEWVFGGFEGTLRALMRWAKPGGTVVASTPHWLAEPPDEYLEDHGLTREQFTSQAETLQCAASLGLELVYMVSSSLDDWDEYESLSWLGAAAYVREHPDDPDNAEIVEWTRRRQRAYLAHGRECLGWATYVFRKP
jgi:ubiquinone/menaquinone biosynthesis C-methylase UbiE